MTRNTKGTLEEPVKMVAQKSGLNKSILSQSWGEFIRILEYKVYWLNKRIIKVSPKNINKECGYKGGYHYKENHDNQAVFNCKKCGHTCNTDINASNNIKYEGLMELLAPKLIRKEDGVLTISSDS